MTWLDEHLAKSNTQSSEIRRKGLICMYVKDALLRLQKSGKATFAQGKTALPPPLPTLTHQGSWTIYQEKPNAISAGLSRGCL